MKKIILSIVTFILMFVMMPSVNAEEKVPVYMFTKEGCPACTYAKEYFDKLEGKYPDLFELIEFEVFDANWNATNDNLKELLIAVYNEFGEDTKAASTPTIVIGDYHTLGITDEDVIYEEIIKVRDSEQKVDKVKELAQELNIDLNNLNEEPKEESSYDTFIIIGIFVVLIGGFAALVFASKKQ